MSENAANGRCSDELGTATSLADLAEGCLKNCEPSYDENRSVDDPSFRPGLLPTPGKFRILDLRYCMDGVSDKIANAADTVS